jgi:hypothetical protein
MAPPGLRESRVATPVGPPSKSIGQIERELDTARGRREFFSNRPDVSDDRALRRMKQADELQRFKNLYTKPVYTDSGSVVKGVTQMKQGAPRSLAEESMRLANQYGPTFREIGSDIGYGIRSIGSALGERISQGRFGIMGIAKDLYEQFTNKATQAKDFLGNQVNKLSDIDLEILKNKDKYKLTSQKPDIQLVNQLESNAKQAAENRDLFGSYSTFGGPSMPGEVKREELGSIGLPTTQPTEEELDIIRGAQISNNYSGGLGQIPTFSRTAEMIERNPNTGTETIVEQFQNPNPGLLNALAGQEQVKKSGEQFVQGLRDINYFEQGGSVDNKLNDIQKKTNNIYGTGILSVR